MAKMFYSIEEAAQKLGVPEEQVKQLAQTGKLQQFRDRDKLMFKRDQVDAMSAGSAKAAGESGGPIPLASDDTDKIDLTSEAKTPPGRRDDPRHATGVSVFDAGEVEHADPMAQTQITKASGEDELSLESVGSGSGLLDLTRESDDTSLGAELLDEIYPGSGGEASDAKMEAGATVAAPSAGALESALAGEMTGASGLDNLQNQGEGGVMPVSVAAEPYDPAGSGLSLGFSLGTLAALVILMIVTITALAGIPAGLVGTFATNGNNLLMYCGGLLVAGVIFGIVGMVVGKARG